MVFKSANAAVAVSFSQLLNDLGGIAVARVCMDLSPGNATIDDLVRLNGQGGMYELVDATLVEKVLVGRFPAVCFALRNREGEAPAEPHRGEQGHFYLECQRLDHWIVTFAAT